MNVPSPGQQDRAANQSINQSISKETGKSKQPPKERNVPSPGQQDRTANEPKK
jgi:hypothetical protein